MLLILFGVLALAVLILNWTYGRLPAEPKPTGSFIQVGKLRIHYIEHPGAGTPVVLIHGLPGTAEDWEDVTPLLAGHRTIAIDRPGFGYSSGGYVPFDRQLEVIHELLAKLHVVRPILVGPLLRRDHLAGTCRALSERCARARARRRGRRRAESRRLHRSTGALGEIPAAAGDPQISNATFGQLLITVSADQGDAEAFSPLPVVAAHRRRVLEINMTHGNLEAWSGEILASTGVIAQIDKGLSGIETPTVVIQGEQDELVNQSHGRKLAATLPTRDW